MADKRIWAPWRIGYIAGEEPSTDMDQEGLRISSPASTLPENKREPSQWRPDAHPPCFLCRGAASYTNEMAARKENLVLWKGEHVLVLLNRYPYTNGHLLVSPLRHVAQLHEMTDQEHLEAMHTLGRFTEKVRQLFKADGFNIGLNLGAIAGAGVPGHLHWHLVPRWEGDHNFMPTLAGTRVIPQSLTAVWETLAETS